MYWNLYWVEGVTLTLLINRNMRCIEIFDLGQVKKQFSGLIETWDVLKSYR